MKQHIITGSLALVVAILAGGAVFVLTGETETASATVASTPEVTSAATPTQPTAPPTPTPEPAEIVMPDAASEGIYMEPNYANDREMILQVMASRTNFKRNVLNVLNDPDSAQFRTVFALDFDGGKAVVFCGQMNARNALGGYGPFRAFYGVGNFVAVDDGGEVFAMGFRRECDSGKPLVASIDNF